MERHADLVVRHYERYTPEQRANRAASHRLGPRQRLAVGEYIYTHPYVPGVAFTTRAAAARAGLLALERKRDDRR